MGKGQGLGRLPVPMPDGKHGILEACPPRGKGRLQLFGAHERTTGSSNWLPVWNDQDWLEAPLAMASHLEL